MKVPGSSLATTRDSSELMVVQCATSVVVHKSRLQWLKGVKPLERTGVEQRKEHTAGEFNGTGIRSRSNEAKSKETG